MKKTISRRRFLERATAAGGGALLGTAALAHTPDIEKGKSPVEAPKGTDREKPDYERVVRLPVYKARIEPHWLADGSRFWYKNDGPHATKEFIFVDATQGARRPAFDHQRLAAALAQAAGQNYTADHLPFNALSFTDDAKAIHFHAAEKDWQCDLTSYTCTVAEAPPNNGATPEKQGEKASEENAPPGPTHGEAISPNGEWTAFIRDHNVYVRGKNDPTEKALTKDGTEEQHYDRLRWSPDSKMIAGYRIHPVPVKPVFLIESSPKDGGTRGLLHQHEYAQPGDPFPTHEPFLFDPASGTATAVTVDPITFGEEPPDLIWRPDGSGFVYEQIDRGHQRFRIHSVDARTGQVKMVVDEQSKTFINTSNSYTYYTKDAAQVIYVSEQEGWRHLYLYDTINGSLKNRITTGQWVVRSIDRVDEDARQIWFQGSGRNPGENPYHIHHYRINFDGTGLVALTDGDGAHTIQYSPKRDYLIDTYSRPDHPPVHTLRKVSDGSQVCPLETADISALTTAGWRAPEVFTAKGRDGQTDIWGVVFRPLNFDPKKRYPIIENIYAGPQDSFVRQHFSVGDGMQALAELGFIVVQCDGMGTRNRSKAFHDVCWRNLKDAGFPDRIAWIKALAARYPYIDTTRVGIYGTSAGGQSSTGAMLFHPEFYKVAVSSCGCHDNRVDKRWWNEQWMGYPLGPWYEDSSNITHAANLRGKLLLMVGELDTNVPPESTIRLTDALIKADKDFDLIVITGSNHTGGGPYGERRRRDFFVRHLLGVEPPDRNAPKPKPVPVVLHPRATSEESLANSESGPDTTIDFRNHTAGVVHLYWLPGDGRRVPYGTIAPGAAHTLHTYSGHYWLITDADDKPLTVFVGETAPGIANIGQPAQPSTKERS